MNSEIRRPAWRAALLNLSGLGLGYLHLRAWFRFLVALLVTVGGVVLALPVTWDGRGWSWIGAYAGVLALLAADAGLLAVRRAARGRRRLGLRFSSLRRAAWASLAVVPLSAAVYGVVQYELFQQKLEADVATVLDGLHDQTGSWRHFSEKHYPPAYVGLVDLADRYPHTRAGTATPGTLAKLYEGATEDGDCSAGRAAAWFASQDRTSQYSLAPQAMRDAPGLIGDCAVDMVDGGRPAVAADNLRILLTDYPDDDATVATVGELRDRRERYLNAFTKGSACKVLEPAEYLDEMLREVRLPETRQLARDVPNDLLTARFECGLDMFGDHRYSEAVKTIEPLQEAGYGGWPYAARVLAAARVASEVGESIPLPPRTQEAMTTPAIITIRNFAHADLRIDFAGPATGSVVVEACAGKKACKPYPDDAAGQAACDTASDASTETVLLPAGTYWFVGAWDGGQPFDSLRQEITGVGVTNCWWNLT
ncbi:hypothetical protein GCM10027059_35540 [Myceligenerans halotolerans]